MLAYRSSVGVLVAGFFVGVVAASFLDFGWPPVILFLSLAAILFLFRLITVSPVLNYLALVLFFVGLALGTGRFQLALESKPSLPLGSEVTLVGWIVSEPDEREAKTRLVVEEAKTENKILVFVERFPKYFYGEKIKLTGELKRPENFETTNGRIFDYEKYLAARDIEYQIFYPKIEKLATAPWSITGSLILVKNFFQKRIERVIPEPAAALAEGLLLGGRTGLGDKLEQDFRTVGISHIIVLSGYNLSVVANYILVALFFLPRQLALGGSVIGVFLFTLMVGGGASVIRASIMAIVTLLARGYGRLYEASVALIFAGLLMVLWNPKVLVFDLGFQLSFLATLGLIYLSPRLETGLKFVTEKWGLREIITTTLAAQLTVYPWLIYKMGNLSLVGFVVNILVLPLVPLAMLFSFLTGLVGILGSSLSLPFAYVSYFILEYIIKLAEFFARWPVASINIEHFPWWLVGFIYLVMTILVLRGKLGIALQNKQKISNIE